MYLSHHFSANWCVIGKHGKDKRYSPWSDNCEKIINYAATCLGLGTGQIISPLCLSQEITGLMVAVGPIPFLSNGSS